MEKDMIFKKKKENYPYVVFRKQGGSINNEK